MQFVYEQFDYLPVWARPPVIALIMMIIGYFFAKILSAISSNLSTFLFRNNEDDVSVFPKRLGRFVFWVLWSWFLYAGFSQFQLVSSVFEKWDFRNPNFGILIPIGLIIFILHTTSDIRDVIYAKLSQAKLNYASPKFIKFFGNTILFSGLFLFIVLSNISLNSPTNFVTKIIASIFMLFFGVLTSKILKEVIFGAIALPKGTTTTSKLASQFTVYFVFASFVFTIIEIWI